MSDIPVAQIICLCHCASCLLSSLVWLWYRREGSPHATEWVLQNQQGSKGEAGSLTSEVPDHRRSLPFFGWKAPSGKKNWCNALFISPQQTKPPRWLWSICCVALLRWLPAKPVCPKGKGYLSDYSSHGSGKDHWLVCGWTGWNKLANSPALFMLPLVCFNSCFLLTSWRMWVLCAFAYISLCDLKALLSFSPLSKDLYNTSVLPSRTVFSKP